MSAITFIGVGVKISLLSNTSLLTSIPKLRILHESAIGDALVEKEESKSLWVDPHDDSIPDINATAYMFLKTAQNWSQLNNLFIEVIRCNEIAPRYKAKKIEKLHKRQFFFAGEGLIDEVHETKGQGTTAITKMRSHRDFSCSSLSMLPNESHFLYKQNFQLNLQ